MLQRLICNKRWQESQCLFLDTVPTDVMNVGSCRLHLSLLPKWIVSLSKCFVYENASKMLRCATASFMVGFFFHCCEWWT